MTVDHVTTLVSDWLDAREVIVSPFIDIIERDRAHRSPEDLAGQFAEHTTLAIANADGVRWVIQQLAS